jgi:hypothetical protein
MEIEEEFPKRRMEKKNALNSGQKVLKYSPLNLHSLDIPTTTYGWHDSIAHRLLFLLF